MKKHCNATSGISYEMSNRMDRRKVVRINYSEVQFSLMRSKKYCVFTQKFSRMFGLVNGFCNLNCDNVELEEGVSYVHELIQIFILFRGAVPEDALAEEAPSGTV